MRTWNYGLPRGWGVVNWTRRIFWLVLILVLEVILMAFLLLRYLAA